MRKGRVGQKAKKSWVERREGSEIFEEGGGEQRGEEGDIGEVGEDEVKEGDEGRKGGEDCQLGRRRFRPKSKGGDLGRRKVRRRRGRGEEKSSCQDGCLHGTEL